MRRITPERNRICTKIFQSETTAGYHTFPIASKLRSKKNMTPMNMKNNPNPVSPPPISEWCTISVCDKEKMKFLERSENLTQSDARSPFIGRNEHELRSLAGLDTSFGAIDEKS